jgi:nitrate reductase (NAD(P)H)
VPKLAWETHTLEIFSDPPGLLDPAELSMDEIAKDYKAIEIPVTLACTGARREEVNRVKKSGGFGWSAAAVSTCMWTGALLRDILLARNMVEQPEHERWYLNYEGADEPSEGKYATSIPLSYAMDPVNDVMLAYGINGAPLHPDHGYPLRSLIPSFVGGRCVKWLKKIWISKKPNDSHYHIWDNRVVPSFVTSKQSRLGKAFFHSPSTIINEQCLQSVIVKPAHGQYIPLQGEASGKQGLDRKIKVSITLRMCNWDQSDLSCYMSTG